MPSPVRQRRERSANAEAAAPAGGARAWPLFVVPLIAFVVYAVYSSRQYSFDTLERAYLLEHPLHYLKSWDGSERSQFLFFAHPLELPAAWLLGRALPFLHGHDVIRVFGFLSTAASLWAVGALVRLAAPAVFPAIAAQLVLGTSIGFWFLGSAGEERIPALATQLITLWCFWRTLGTGRGARWVGVLLPVAILMHLTGAVLVPFMAIALLLAKREDPQVRRRLVIALAAGSAAAGLAMVLIAVFTSHVRSVGEFLSYATFYHRAAGNNFFELTGVTAKESRFTRALFGLGSIFAGLPWSRFLVFAAFLGIGSIWLLTRKRAAAPASKPVLPQKTMLVHCAILCGLWAAHFLFYEPRNFESWTLPGALITVVAGIAAAQSAARYVFFVMPVYLFCVNIQHYQFNHRWLPWEAVLVSLRQIARPQDIFLVLGGRHGGLPIRGSFWTRYFLARDPGRTIVSLYDVLTITEKEFWPRPFRSPEELQAAIDSGRRCFAPVNLKPDLDSMSAGKLFAIDYVVRGDLLEITDIQRGPMLDAAIREATAH